MSTDYILHLEGVSTNNERVCLDSYFPRLKSGKWSEHKVTNVTLDNLDEIEFVLAPLYTNGSRSYFGQTANKLQELGKRIEYKDLSETLKHRYHYYNDDEKSARFYSILIKDMLDCIPNGDMKDHCGYITKEQLFNVEHDDYEIWEWLSPSEYKKLNKDEKQAYVYHEWDDDMGWNKHFKIIRNRINNLLNTRNDVFFCENVSDLRIIMYIC